MIRFLKKKNIHQVKNSTSYNRYPEIFKATQEYFDHLKKSNIKILSYGCSTGEECYTLREYFPKAYIIGLDVDANNIQISKSKNKDDKILFQESTLRNLNKNGSYDLIFCMSVFCRWPDSRDINDISEMYPFSKFEETLLKIGDNLNQGGLLVLYNCNFCFKDTSLYSHFKVLENPSIKESGFVHKFGANNLRLGDQQYNDCIFIKQGS